MRHVSWLGASSVLIAAVLALPVLVIVGFVFSGSLDVWQHLYETVLADYVINSLLLMLGVSVGVLLLGVPTAWLTSICDFPGRWLFSWALLLPLAVPAYIIAYTYTGMLDAAGPLQTLLREQMGWAYGDYWFFNIRSLPGAIVMLTLVLYPYVYLLTRAALLERSASILEAGRTLGYSRFQGLLVLSLPMARPAIIAGLTLALMETLADYGTVQYFGISTFTTGIFRTFYGFGDTAAAAQLAAMLLSFVVLLIVLERYSRRRSRYYVAKGRPATLVVLSGIKGWLAFGICLLPLLLGFIVPALQLGYWSLAEAEIDREFIGLIWNSFYLACITALLAVVLATLLAYAKRLHPKPMVNGAVATASMGYALPGTIIAIGIIIPLTWLDHTLIAWARQWFSADIGLVFSGTLVALVFAYTVRFLAVSFGAVESGMQKIKPNIDNAARLLGDRPLQVLYKIYLPLMKGSILTAFLIVFVDTLKELPATLILRPFNFNTLAVRAHELASDERLADAAPASLLIVLVGLVPVILLSRSISLTMNERTSLHKG